MMTPEEVLQCARELEDAIICLENIRSGIDKYSFNWNNVRSTVKRAKERLNYFQKLADEMVEIQKDREPLHL